MSWKFDYQPSSGKTGAIGTVYTLGFMDAWSSNSSKKYGVYSTSSQDTRDAGNFDFTVNGNLVDKKAYMQKTFEELTAGGEDSSKVGDNYSPIALIPVGEVVLNSGDNTFVYKRTGSYNFVISDLVFIGEEFAHEHTAATTWSKDETQHWHACTAPGCPVVGGYKMDAANHTFVEVSPEDDTETDAAHKAKAATCSAEGIKVEVCSVCQYRKESVIEKKAHTFPEDGGWTVNKAATCDEAGERQHKCTVCEEIVKEAIPALGHDFSGGVAKAYAATADHIAAEAVNCGNCQKSALQWSALDYDEAKTTAASDKAPKSADSGKAVQFDTSVTQGMGDDHSGKGTHLIYVVDVPEAVENANLAMLATEAPYRADMFDQMTNENSRGYYQNAEGEWVVPDSRYGVKVDGVEYMVAKNNGAIKGAGTAWYQFPGISLTLTAGVHEFEFFKYGGYDVSNYSFRLIGLSHVTPAHEHTLGEWQSDDTNHWKLCTGEGCLDPVGTKYEQAAHTWGDVVQTEAPTHTKEGAGTKECTVCHKVVNVVIPAIAHTWGDATPVAAGDGTVAYNKFECSGCDSIKLEIALDDSMLASGSTNKNEPFGFMKLSGNNQSFSFSFDYDSLALGKVYQRGVMDGWSDTAGSGNGTKKVFSGGSGGADDFELLVNNAKVDLSPYKNKTYADVMPGPSQIGHKGSATGSEMTLSPTTDVETGSITLKNGVNTVKYTRKASYNLANSHIVFVVENSSHEHNNTEAWDGKDANQHWHVCSAEGCPEGGKIGAENHTWNDGEVTTAATVDAEGVKTFTCTKCGQTKTEVIKRLAFKEWSDSDVISACSKSSPSTKTYASGIKGLKTSNIKNSDSNKVTLTYTADAAKTVTFRLLVSIKVSNNASTGFWKANDGKEKTRITFNDVKVTPPETDWNFKAAGCTVEDATADDSGKLSVPVWVDICNLELQAGENTIVIEVIDTNFSYFICGAALANA